MLIAVKMGEEEVISGVTVIYYGQVCVLQIIGSRCFVQLENEVLCSACKTPTLEKQSFFPPQIAVIVQ